MAHTLRYSPVLGELRIGADVPPIVRGGVVADEMGMGKVNESYTPQQPPTHVHCDLINSPNCTLVTLHPFFMITHGLYSRVGKLKANYSCRLY
jgi:hypothetical protein